MDQIAFFLIINLINSSTKHYFIEFKEKVKNPKTVEALGFGL